MANYYTLGGPDIPRDLLGPTGLVYMVNGRAEIEKMHYIPLDDRWMVFPLLVPGQINVGDILDGVTPSKEQLVKATGYAICNECAEYYMSEEDAKMAIASRQRLLDSSLYPFIRDYMHDRPALDRVNHIDTATYTHTSTPMHEDY